MGNRFTADELRQYQQDGYLIARGLFSAAEIDRLVEHAKSDPLLATETLRRADGEGGVTKLRLFNQADDDIYGRFARCERMVNRIEQLLDGEAYFYHAKINYKEPFTGGAWAWHQDYGYWYKNGCLFPYMASCMIALDRCTRKNGCLQVLAGSHHLGRVEHGKVGDQTGADPERVEQALKFMPLVYVEKEPGDAVFFHCNLLHRSDQNTSTDPRWTYICCYNAARNNPYKEHHHPRYHPLIRAADDSLLAAAASA